MANQFDPKEGQETEEVVDGAASQEVSEETTSQATTGEESDED